jgi:hypothetical protein
MIKWVLFCLEDDRMKTNEFLSLEFIGYANFV